MIKSLSKVLVLGSGALKIGEAGEFDYSGTQALKALKEENIKTVIINPNIATIQTSEGIADIIYFLPITSYFIEKVIEKEKPDGILLSFGGQTALNCGIELNDNGVLEKYNVEVLGTSIQTIKDTEDRELFVKKLEQINVKTPKSIAVNTIKESIESANKLKYPIIIRSAYALGGQGSGFCENEKEIKLLSSQSLSFTNQILIEESLKGWKEIEYEVIRDKYDNCVTVCNMENFDPLGIHTGESIVVAPCQSLTNVEINYLRELSIKIVKHLNIIGECNIQYALDPISGDYRVIELNARLSRSSALASKAIGYPLAFIAAKISLGYSINDLNVKEPILDYIICKIPRWDLDKFHGVSREIGSNMKSVGEVMSIGKTFEEAIQKGLRMIGQGMHGFVANKDIEDIIIDKELSVPTDMRIFIIAKALMNGYDIDKIYELTKIDKWFLNRLKNIYDLSKELMKFSALENISDDLLIESKKMGFSDFQIARLVLKNDQNHISDNVITVRKYRKNRNITPWVKKIDTSTCNYPTYYLYLTYDSDHHDIEFNIDKKTIIVLGSGAYRIGSSVEFDWCGVNALQTIRKHGIKSIMINYNPETVSTDYDISDKLYFEELTFERVMDIIDIEPHDGVIISTGGQIPNNLAMRLFEQKVKILGTSPLSIDKSENRHKFSNMLDELNINQPKWKEFSNLEEIFEFTDNVGFPVIIRPSYVLSGAAMNIISNKNELEYFLKMAVKVSKQYPVVLSKFIEDAKEIELDAVSKNGQIICYAISEHVEFAGVHSGDATILFPPQKIYVETIRKIKKISKLISESLKISGPFNIQFLAKDNDVLVIECNLRSSRTFPFISKILKTNFIELSTEIMLDIPVSKPDKTLFDLDYVGVKASQFSFSRLQKADPMLGVEMMSTGEVGCVGENYYEAILLAMLSVGYKIPTNGVLISSGPSRSKVDLLNSAKMILNKGLKLYATKGTHEFFLKNNLDSTLLHWPDETKYPNTIEYLRNKKIDLVINIPKDLSKSELDNDYQIRRNAIEYNIPLITNSRLASAFIYSICYINVDDIPIKHWKEY